ncbi:hypothetical protein [Flavivirga spongiicola]|uniref:Uncharacterized protein n=1 Tax=Flavivirga spongiicola TaxID=421621 RepID=A0ABU7XZU9_9FLAO|nr:hypothetical protein [Flavivirga sp. MEBiC05379]MDO5980988.1 hypothetical protein [Flavivirga sp. MEBiC05379]
MKVNKQNKIEQEIIKKSNHLEYLKFEMIDDIWVVSLNDLAGYTIVKGYGETIIEAINDMHRGVI